MLLLKKEYTDKFPKKIPYDKISDNFNLIYLIEGNNLKEFRENCLKKGFKFNETLKSILTIYTFESDIIYK